MIKYLFFDFDGVVIDSEPIYQMCWIGACKEYGFVLSPEQELKLRSRDHQMTEDYFHELFGPTADYHKIHAARVKLMEEYLKTHQFPLKAGILEVFKYIKEKTNIKIAIVTSSSIEYVNRHGGYNNILSYLDKIISVRNMPRGKPFPYVYLAALEEAGVNKDEVIVLEDSNNGVSSAYEAGLKVVFVEDLSPVDEEIKNKSEYQIRDIRELLNILNPYFIR